ncbi:MAG: hypothetical protein ACR2P4_01620, partial [Gammaproteobacteria bacterium]
MMTSALCALRVLPFAAASPPFALARKWTNGKEMDSRFRGNDEGGGNDEGDVVCRAFVRAGRGLAAFADNGIMQRSNPCAVRRAPCAVRRAMLNMNLCMSVFFIIGITPAIIHTISAQN